MRYFIFTSTDPTHFMLVTPVLQKVIEKIPIFDIFSIESECCRLAFFW